MEIRIDRGGIEGENGVRVPLREKRNRREKIEKVIRKGKRGDE